MATSEQYIQLAKALPAQLQRFLARYPPASILGSAAVTTTTTTTTSSASSTDALSTPAADVTAVYTISPTAGQPAASPPVAAATAATSRSNRPVVPGLAAAEQHLQPATPHTSYQAERPDPFSWLRHPVTGRWISPVYSARRQAQLFQLARAHGVEELLPPSSKSPAARLERRVALGLRVKGTGVGQRVKGHAYEREMEAKMNERRRAMLEMPRLIKNWKRLGRDGWKKWPK